MGQSSRGGYVWSGTRVFLVVGAWTAGLVVGNGRGFGLASFVHVTSEFAGLRAGTQIEWHLVISDAGVFKRHWHERQKNKHVLRVHGCNKHDKYEVKKGQHV